jgi:DNA topoisomerase-1
MRLIICEKDNAANRISSILSDGRVSKESRGRVSVYRFQWEGDETRCMGLRGHILNMDFPKRYNSWSDISPMELIDVKPVRKVSAPSIAKVLRELASSSDKVYVATDFDREGELIGSEAVEYSIGPEALDSVYRAHFSSLTHPEVMSSFSSLTRINKAIASAAETRQILDLIWGATLTRFISISADRLGHDFLSVGRVQSPTLALIVDREREIKEFKPVPFWRIEALFCSSKIEFQGSHAKGDIWEEDVARSLFRIVDNASSARVKDITKKKRMDRPPIPFNTTEFIRAANTLGMSASRIMSVAEDLYTNGFISYPRTDNTVYPKGLDLRQTVEILRKGHYREACDHILKKSQITATRGKKETTDHPPIYPTTYATREELGPEKYKIYDLVVRRFLATLHDPTKLEVTSVKLDVKGEQFNSSGQVILDPGYRSIYTYSKVSENTLPVLEVGMDVEVEKMELLSKETKPPKRYSQGGLIQEMEKLGLGTKSTRHEIIQKLYTRRYIEETPPRPTLSGEALINSLERHAKTITRPDMTARLEEDMERISQSRLDKIDVLNESKEMLTQILGEMEQHKEDIGREISEALREQEIVGKCPRCNNDLYQVRSKRGKRYVRCSQYPGCSKSYPLPQRGKVTFTGQSCEVCRSPMIVMYRRGSRPFEVCMNPQCPSRSREGGSDEDS